MLPPVPKIAAADAANGTTVLVTTRTPVKEIVPTRMGDPAPETSGSLFARAAVASLTGEFQLSRSTAVLAEALGKLMNLPRRDGEAIQTYVTRLTEALRALPASQRLALEQQVGKALQGLTLTMLAEILKQPTGPDAARLALLIELSRYKGADLAARAAVSSYQQNNVAHSETTAAPPGQPRQQTAPNQTIEPRPSFAPTAPAANAAGATKLLPMLIGPLVLSGAAVKATVAALTTPPEFRTTKQVVLADTDEVPSSIAKPDGRANDAARPLPPQAGGGAKEMSGDNRLPNLPRIDNGETRPAVAHRELTKTDSKETRTGIIPPSGPLTDDAETINTLLLAAATGRLPLKAAVPQQALPAPQSAAQQQSDDQATEKAALATPTSHPVGEETDAAANRPEPQMSPRATIDPEARMAMLEQSASQSLLAAALAKDGTPLPIVAYPPADEDYESETPPRGGGPFSEEEAEEEAEAGAEDRDNQEDKEERIAANDTSGEQVSGSPATSDDSAENYYLKMSGML